MLEQGEILEAVWIPRLSRKARWGYYKLCRKTGEFAHAIGAVLHDPERSVCRAVIGATEAKPIVLTDARALFRGEPGTSLSSQFDPSVAKSILFSAGMDDPLESQLHVTALKRAVACAEHQ
ncbi:hypothetical protein D3C80_1891540 [compost metagenome]